MILPTFFLSFTVSLTAGWRLPIDNEADLLLEIT